MTPSAKPDQKPERKDQEEAAPKPVLAQPPRIPSNLSTLRQRGHLLLTSVQLFFSSSAAIPLPPPPPKASELRASAPRFVCQQGVDSPALPLPVAVAEEKTGDKVAPDKSVGKAVAPSPKKPQDVVVPSAAKST